MPRIQRKLIAALVALVAATVLVSAWVAGRGLRAQALARVEDDLARRAALVRALLVEAGPAPGRDVLQEGALRASQAAAARVTLIAADGRVLADSDVPADGLVRMENHAGRPEVARALAGETGVASRESRTVGRRLLYVALPGPPETGVAVVRVAEGLDDVEAMVAALRARVVLGGLAGLAAAVALSYLLARLTVRPLVEMRQVLGDIADGELGRRLRPRSQDELGEMATAINAMAQQLGLRLDEVTAEKEQLHAVLASMVEGVLALDTESRVMLANPRVREQLGLWGPVEGRRLLEVVRHPGIDDALRAAAEATAPVVSEVEVGDRDPRTLLIHASAFPQSGPRMGTVAVFHDVTELRHLENVRRDFVANASHELKTPLTAIRGFAETLLSSGLEGGRQQVEVILRNAERLDHLIRDMMELSRIESRRVHLRPTELDVARLARTLLGDMEPRLRERRLEASLDATKAAPAWADRRAVEQVLTNLLDNAVKYSDPGGHIRVTIEERPDTVRVSVEDEGIGIPQKDQARIFERFYRVDKARSRALGGTGLGLAIVKHLVQALGGDIYVESEPGRGSSFRFSLPRADRRSA